MSNVLKLYRILQKTPSQRVYYNPGIGTIGQQDAWQRALQKVRGVFGLTTGYGLDDEVLNAYRFLMSTYEKGDKLYFFGFSRGAYTVRVLAAFMHVMGLLPRDQLNLATYAFTAYKKASADIGSQQTGANGLGSGDDDSTPLEAAWDFSRVAGGEPVPIEFIGVWDTVASVIVPRWDRLVPSLQMLRFTRTNPSVRNFRQAIAIDERRRMFRLNRWTDPQEHRPNAYQPNSTIAQSIRQVWFAGVHSDVGGGYQESESGLAKFPLIWMINQASKAGLAVRKRMIRRLVFGDVQPGDKYPYVAPSATAAAHNSMTFGWSLLEWIPKQWRWHEDKSRAPWLGWYLPKSEPRTIPEGAILHYSVLLRREAGIYSPPNLPVDFGVEQESQEEEEGAVSG